MRQICFSLAVIVMIFTSLAPAHAAEQYGVQVYGGAELDMQQTAFGREIAGADMYCYRTGESVAEVIGFYKSHRGLTFMGGDETHALFVKEDGNRTVRVMVVSPWTEAKTGKMKADTLIQIIKE